MDKPFKSETRYRNDWSVTIYAALEESGFYTECISSSGVVLSTNICSDKGSAWQQGYNLVDRAVEDERTRRYNAIAIPLTLGLLYVSGWDERDKLNDDEYRFIGRRTWKGYDFDILDILTEQGLLEEQSHPKQVKSVAMTLKGIKQAREILRSLNLERIEEFLQALAEHDDL